jgi:anthranilate synthase component 1
LKLLISFKDFVNKNFHKKVGRDIAKWEYIPELHVDRSPVFCKEIDAGSITPDHCYHQLRSPSSSSFVFHVNEDDKQLTYLGFNPISTFQVKNDPHSFEKLRRFIQDHSLKETLTHFFGFIAYDSVRLTHELPDHHPDEGRGKPDMHFSFFETLLVFDHQKKGIRLLVYDKSFNGEEKIRSLLKKIQEKEEENFNPHPESASITIKKDMDDDRYREVLARAKEYVQHGDVFQVVISRTFFAETQSTPFQIHRALNKINPSPYHFLFETPDFAIIGASPEKLVSVHHGVVEVAVLGGSHPKQKTISEAEQGRQLLSDQKEVDEHNMKMEAARADALKLAEPGTLKEKELRGFRVFSHILHIITRFTCQLRKGYDCVDAIRVVLPSATITGYPKKKAMEIIDSCEANRRGIYGGAICLIDSEGNLTSALTIRTILLDHGTAYIRAGAALVSNSDLDYEVNESTHKANAALETLKKAEEYPP